MSQAVLDSFFKEVGHHKLLTRDDEVSLSQRIKGGDKTARELFISSNLRLAVSIAKRYMNKGCSFEDLVQESSVGLIKAVDRFDHTKGFKFSTYATWWIRQSVRRHVTDQSCSIRMPAPANAFYHRAKMMISDYTKEFGCPPSDDEVAEFMGVSLGKYLSLMNTYRATLSLDSSAIPGDSDGPRLHETIASENESPDLLLDQEKMVEIIRRALSSLTPREEKIIRLRFGITEQSDDHHDYPITDLEINALDSREVI